MAELASFRKSEKLDIKLLNNCTYNRDIKYICVYVYIYLKVRVTVIKHYYIKGCQWITISKNGLNVAF